MVDALSEHSGTINIGGRSITNLRFADDVDGLAGSEEELARLVTSLDQTALKYGMEIGAEKTKLMTNSVNPITTRITVARKELETVQQFNTLVPLSMGKEQKLRFLQELRKPQWQWEN